MKGGRKEGLFGELGLKNRRGRRRADTRREGRHGVIFGVQRIEIKNDVRTGKSKKAILVYDKTLYGKGIIF